MVIDMVGDEGADTPAPHLAKERMLRPWRTEWLGRDLLHQRQTARLLRAEIVTLARFDFRRRRRVARDGHHFDQQAE